MELKFPQQPGLNGAFVVGFRKRPASTTTEEVGAVVLKGDYTVVAERLQPQANGPGCRDKDEPYPLQPDFVRYESDFAPFKPRTDCVVLDYVPASMSTCSLSIDGVTRLQASAPPAATTDLFGWDSRLLDPRKSEAGTFSSNPNDYPPQWPPPFDRPQLDPLPADYDNSYLNGQSRAATVGPTTYLNAGQSVSIVRNQGTADEDQYRFSLPSERPVARLFEYSGSGADDESAWTSSEIPMRLDTLVIEPATDQCSIAWRGVFAFNRDAAYRRLTVEVTV